MNVSNERLYKDTKQHFDPKHLLLFESLHSGHKVHIEEGLPMFEGDVTIYRLFCEHCYAAVYSDGVETVK